jgi:hypothetical protein
LKILDDLSDNRPALWKPLAGPQAEAYYSDADELFYGGAAGGGKTDLVLGLASTAHTKSIIFRREYPQLKDIIDRSVQIIGQQGRFNGQAAIWRMNDGRTIEFGAVQHESDVNKFQGRAHDLKAFDELPNFTEFQYRFLIGWNRTTKLGQRVRVVGAGNPPTNADGEWVIRRWAPWLDNQHPRPAKPGELRWFAMLDGEDTEVESGKPFTHKGEEIKPKSRTFIPAKLSDNPYLMATDYAATLQAMPEPLRTQLLKGDFHVSLEDNPWQIIPTLWIELAQARWRERSKPNLPLSALGVDIARGGKDKTVIAQRYGNWFDELKKYPGTMTPDGDSAAIYVAQAHKDNAAVNMDIIGVGTAAQDATVRLGIAVNGVNFAEGSTATDKSGKFKFVNLRAEAYWKFREALDPKTGDDIALPPDPELKADLCAPRWKLTARGIQVESKEDIIERLKRSPDSGDAVVLSHILAPLIVPFVQGKAQGWNPR